MDKMNQGKALTACKNASATLARLEKLVFNWAQAKTKLPKDF